MVDFVVMGRESGKEGEGREEEIKMVKKPYVFVPVPQNECNYYVSQTYM